MTTKRDNVTAELDTPQERPSKKSKITHPEKTIPFGVSALLGASVLGGNQISEYERAVQLLEKHIDHDPDPRLKHITDEAKKDLEYIQSSKIYIAVVGPAGQGKSTFGNKLLWMLDASADKDDDKCNFPLLTSDEDHKTNRCIYCSSSDDGSWKVSFLTLSNSQPEACQSVSRPYNEPWDESSVREFLADPRVEAEMRSFDWDTVLGIQLEGPFKLPKRIALIDTPGWNFNFSDSSREVGIDASIKHCLGKASVFIYLSIAARIHGKEDIQTLLEKIPPSSDSPVIIPAWSCTTAPQRHHAEKIRHALQTLKSDTACSLSSSDEKAHNENLSDPWERYQLFDSMMKSTMLFTVPYSFNHLESFFKQVRDMHAHPRLVKLHWEFKAFTIFSKRSKKGGSLDDAEKLAKFLEAQSKELVKLIWSEEARVLSDIDDFCSLAWDEMVVAHKLSASPQKKKYWSLYQPIGAAILSLRQKTILIYTKLFIKAIDHVEFAKPIEEINFITDDEDDSDSETEDSQKANEILDNEYYQLLEKNFTHKFRESFVPKKVHSAIVNDMKGLLEEFAARIPSLFQQGITSFEESGSFFEISDELPTYKQLREDFIPRLRVILEESWKTNIADLKLKANDAIKECIELLRVNSPSNPLNDIAECIQEIKMSNPTQPKPPLTAKDPLVHINKISDIVSQFEKQKFTVSNAPQPWKTIITKNQFKQTEEHVISVSGFQVKSKESTFSFSLAINKAASDKIQEFSAKLNTAAALEKTLFPIFMISNYSEENKKMEKRKNVFRLADLDLEIINDGFLLFIVIPQSQLEHFRSLVNKQLSERPTAKSRVFYVLLDGADEKEKTSASLWLDVAKSLAEYWKFSFYWRISHNAFYRMRELDMANFGRRQTSLARGLLLLQNLMQNYRYYAAQEFSKILKESRVAVNQIISGSKNPEDSENFFLVYDNKPQSFVSFAALEKLLRTIESEAIKQNNKDKVIADVITKFNNLLRKVSMICAVDGKSLFSKLATCFPFLFMVETSPGFQTRFLSLNNTFAQQNVLSRKYNTNSFAKESENDSFWQDYKKKEYQFAERCKTVNKSLAVVTPYLMFKDNSQ